MRMFTCILVAAGASALVACASQAPIASGTTAANHDSASAATASAKKKDTSAVPAGYRRVMVNGEERFCAIDAETGSRVRKDTICLTREELDAQQDSSRDFMRNLSRQSGTYSGTGANMPAGGPY